MKETEETKTNKREGKMKENKINKGGFFEKMKNYKGITLIALVVTIVVLIILASISIGVINGEDGIIRNSKSAKEAAEIDSEKEAINISATKAIGDNVFGNLNATDLEEEIKEYTKSNNIEVTQEDDTIYVEFKEKNRIYEVDSDGNAEIFIPYEDKTPGELAEDDNGNFMIESIEDLVTFSAMVNGGYSNENISIPHDNCLDKTIILMRNLNFESKWSYEDYTTTIYNGYLGIDDDTIQLKDALTNTTKYQGFIPIGDVTQHSFAGTFDGRNNRIENIAENLTTLGGLFGSLNDAVIKNIAISGNIRSSEDTGGIAGRANHGTNNIIMNCTNYATISSDKRAGGILGASILSITIQECSNKGEINSEVAGGISGIGGERQNAEVLPHHPQRSRLFGGGKAVLGGL